MDDEQEKLIPTKKIKDDSLQHLTLSGVKLSSTVLGRGSYATVYKAEYNRTLCAVKQVNISIKTSRFGKRAEQNFLLECLQHSKLSHLNIVKMLGVFYPKKETLPVLVMELMEYNLTQLLKRSHNILMYVKLSILQDVSRGLCYLHAQNPPIVHQALYSNNILFTKGLTAKIADFKTGAETVSDQALLDVRRKRESKDFLPELQDSVMKYDLPLNVFSFGCIVCHVITEMVPSIQLEPSINSDIGHQAHDRFSVPILEEYTSQIYVSSLKKKKRDERYVKKRQCYIDMIGDDSLRQLTEACLQYDAKSRPHILQAYKRISHIMTGEFIITLYAGL